MIHRVVAVAVGGAGAVFFVMHTVHSINPSVIYSVVGQEGQRKEGTLKVRQ